MSRRAEPFLDLLGRLFVLRDELRGIGGSRDFDLRNTSVAAMTRYSAAISTSSAFMTRE